jgi:hypothetical protein
MREKGLTYRTKGGVSKTEYAVEVTPGQASGPLAKRGRIIVTLIKEGRS